MTTDPLQRLIQRLAKLPGLGPRSGRRLALHLLSQREEVLAPLVENLKQVEAHVKTCGECGNLDVQTPCQICENPKRQGHVLCVVESVADLWALERTASFGGLYHVLGGTLSALDGVGPEDLNIPALLARAQTRGIEEVILALNATVDGQTTSHYLTERLKDAGIQTISSLARGVPVGGELDYLDDGTLTTALSSRRAL